MSKSNEGSSPGAGPSGLNADGGCAVDWTFLAGRTVVSASSSLDSLTLTFGDGTTLEVRALSWQGKPFLAFEPYR